MKRIIVIFLMLALIVGVVFSGTATAQFVEAEQDSLPTDQIDDIESVPDISGEWDYYICWLGQGCGQSLNRIGQDGMRITLSYWIYEDFWMPFGVGVTFNNLIIYKCAPGCYPVYWGIVVNNNFMCGVMKGIDCQGTWYATRSSTTNDIKPPSGKSIPIGPLE